MTKRKFRYVEPGFQNEALEYEYSEGDIIREYWLHWVALMEKKYHPGHHLITWENCIDDWVTLHWAWEVKE